MNWLKRLAISFWQDEQAQTTTEYVLIVAVVAMIAIKMGETLRDRILSLFTDRMGRAEGVINDQFGF